MSSLHAQGGGSSAPLLPLNEMIARWRDLPRRRPAAPRYLLQGERIIQRFVGFVQDQFPDIRGMGHMTPAITREFMKEEERRGVSAKTYNNNLVLLRSCFTKVGKEIGLRDNPFANIPLRDEETVLRQPYSEEELAAILESAKGDPFIYPIIVTAACTAMRRGDCCLLEKSSVDLDADFLRVKTAKTGEWVEIPIFPMLRQVLLNAEANDSCPYMFPQQAAQYLKNPDRITEMAGRVLRKAGFTDSGEMPANGRDQPRGPRHSPRQVGVRRASLRDFHSFRVTWVTLALVAGVPIEVVKRVTGHRTVEVVVKHYFRPGREEMRQSLNSRMPAVLTGQG